MRALMLSFPCSCGVGKFSLLLSGSAADLSDRAAEKSFFTFSQGIRSTLLISHFSVNAAKSAAIRGRDPLLRRILRFVR